jgi:hypothetical protein
MICHCVVESPRPGWVVVAKRTTGRAGPNGEHAVDYEICPDCGGSLIAHCCEGICAQPETSGPRSTE